MNGAAAFRDVIEAWQPCVPGVMPARILLNAREVAELLHVDVEWVAARRQLLPCFDVPSDDGLDSLARMRVRVEDLAEWKRATRETR